MLISAFIKFRTGIINKEKIYSIELRNGDLLFRRGRSFESFAVYLADREREFTHVGIIVEDNGTPWVVHVVPGEQGCKSERIRKESPAFFLSRENASSFALVRSDFDQKTLARVAEQALLFYQKRVTFDDQYDLSTENKLYCTELILKAFQNADSPLQGIETRELDYVLGKHSIIFPGEILRNPAFKRIEITQPFIIKN
ncbi:MAG: hypothetical protein JXA23_10190 [Bacteroidales bacterium]|nr:hypothetical protein [Bacteroidales bacterium]